MRLPVAWECTWDGYTQSRLMRGYLFPLSLAMSHTIEASYLFDLSGAASCLVVLRHLFYFLSVRDEVLVAISGPRSTKMPFYHGIRISARTVITYRTRPIYHPLEPESGQSG